MSYDQSYDEIEDNNEHACGICGRKLDASNRSKKNPEYCKFCMPNEEDGEELDEDQF